MTNAQWESVETTLLRATTAIETMTNAQSDQLALIDDSALTPAMRQYVEQKKQVPDALLLFRMGDFYEIFYEDAKTAARVLGLTLTSRSKGPDPVPLAGIPYHALEGYLTKLVAAGFKVAISEQVEDPKQAKGVVRRDIVRVVTAGTLTEDSLLNRQQDNYLAALCGDQRRVGLAGIDLSTGAFLTYPVQWASALDQLVRLRPAEILIQEEAPPEIVRLAQELKELIGATITRRLPHTFADYNAEQSLLAQFGVATLAGFGYERMDAGLHAAGAIIDYLKETQKTALKHVVGIGRHDESDHLKIDVATWRSLEIERTIRQNAREGSLLAAIDRTTNPLGSRRMRQWLCFPSVNRDAIVARQEAVGQLKDDGLLRGRLRQKLKSMGDIERISARVGLGRCTPRDLAGLARTLALLPELQTDLSPSHGVFLQRLAQDLGGLEELRDYLAAALRPDAPLTVREGGIIAPGFDAEVDRLHDIGRNGQAWLAEYQQKETRRTGIGSLKVGFNKVFGYYVEITNTYRDRVPQDYVRKQTVKNAERYITDELKRFEEEALTAQDRANEREYQLFEQIKAHAAKHIPALQRAADAAGTLDVVAGLGELAVQRNYVRPELVEESVLDIDAGRHPVLDQTLADAFVPNDTHITGKTARLLLITGPNMAGKSTYIRQTALITLLAQTGSFVPAAAMRWGLVDRIFARVGASDELTRGQSTFMVEMTESANILNNATRESLVILDELGRGTSTFDGLSLAWAIAEHLAVRTRCRTLFATHYHELTELSNLLEGVVNLNVAVREWPAGEGGDEEKIIFLHQIVPGAADKSYGVHVAKLAGVPRPVIERSKEVLAELEKGFAREAGAPKITRKRTKDPQQLLLFKDPAEDVTTELEKVSTDELSGLQALQLIKQWQDRLRGL